MRIYLIRHADPDYANDALTPLGHQQAAALAERMRGVKIDRIYASPMGRAQLTATYTAKVKGLSIATLPWTKELGHWRIEQDLDERPGQICPWDIHGHHVRGADPLPGLDDWHRWPPLDRPEFKRELDEIVGFSDKLFAEFGYRRERHLYHFDERSDAQIAVFCHGGFGLTWMAHLLALSLPMVWAGFFLPPSSVTTILMDERCDGVATPRCLGVGDLGHLLVAKLPDERPPIGVHARHYY